MEQSLTAIVISIFIIFLFVPTVFLKTNNTDRENMKQNLHFATMAIADCIEIADDTGASINFDELSKGYMRYIENFDASKSNIAIDEKKLLLEFNNILFKSCQDPELYAKAQASIVAKILIYNNQFIMAGGSIRDGDYDYKAELDEYTDPTKIGKFNPAHYFTTDPDPVTGKVYYLNTKNDQLYDENKKIINYTHNVALGGGIPTTDPNVIKYVLNVDNIGTKDYYLNMLNNKIYNKLINPTDDDQVGYRDVISNELLIPRSIKFISLTKEAKNDIIIKKINQVISDYTGGMTVNFPNPENVISRVNMKQKDLNFFEGTTFMVIYKENNYLDVRNEVMEFKNYVVAGYTLK
ncbi:MAG TPA: hypothetical protein DEP72_05420 [Clostridiales bacterium]|nr:MAG: hypothetical protein A2Y18_01890 [Clostridiales bacterium GWD2_32_19]HCC07581.1 hypothetical protein [Clostridiales bacterium]